MGHPKIRKFEKLYGHWNTPRDWIDFLKQTNIEFQRILQPDGQLLYKICDSQANDGDGMTHLTDLNYLTGFQTDMMSHEKSKSHNSKTEVYYVILKKRETDPQTHMDTFLYQPDTQRQ